MGSTSVGLVPVPLLAQDSGNCGTPQIPMRADYPANGIKIMPVDHSPAYLVYLFRQDISSKSGDIITD